MPIIGGNPQASQQVGTDTVQVPNTTFQYSMTRISDLGAAEYTQVGLVVDASPSIEPFKTDMEKMIGTVVDACQTSDRAQNLLIRQTFFHTRVVEGHGWKMLQNIQPSDYDDSIKIGGGTAAYDGTLEAVEVMNDSAAKLTKAKFTVNGITFIITDGENNSGIHRPPAIKAKLLEAQQKETLESHITILIGVGCGDSKTGPQTPREKQLFDYLTEFKNEAGLTHFIPMKDASKSSLAKLAAFISKSISDQSKALGTGGPSKQLTSQSLTI